MNSELQTLYKEGQIFSFNEYLDKGHVALIKVMGDDQFIETAARQSYGDGTRQTSETSKLIRYLLRHDHTSPFEMCEFVFSLKIPIFVARQLVRHRTASLNELSARYSVIPSDMFQIDEQRCNPQSLVNKQGSETNTLTNSKEIVEAISDMHDTAYTTYEWLIEQGLSRELARGVLPTNIYTEMVWKIDLKNLMHFLKLRLDDHAQLEIRTLANIIFRDIWRTGKFDITLEAFSDYVLNARKFSFEELEILNRLVRTIDKEYVKTIIEDSNLDKREKQEFIEKLESVPNNTIN